MKSIKFIIVIYLIFLSINAMALRSDSVSIQNTEIHLAIRNFSAKKINGFCVQTIKFLVPTNTLSLDLSALKVDSILDGNTKLLYAQIGDKLKINLSSTKAVGSISNFKIYYQGTPAADPSGWGGFYFSGDYAFNLGVGFQVNPHSYGRAWFPCIDEFDIKNSYDFFIETDTNYTAACNGLLISNTKIGNSIIWHYREANPLSAYLAAVSVSKFTILKSQHNGIQSQYPVWLNCLPSDTNKIKASFENLPFAIQAFENAFGPQEYSKVGYNFVPFNSGAMEHAGNITYPNDFANGSKTYETLLAHELSHHWWGNAVTCKTAEDMWLNEGWASYCEHFFTEQLYGKQAYKNSILANHLFVLRFAHIRDGNIYSMTNIPHANTYGSHVYKKGASVIYSLRNVLGDSVFFKACKAYQTQYRFTNASTNDMQQVFENSGGSTKANSFFENWVKEKGFPHVIIQKQTHSGSGPFNLEIKTYQKPRFTNKLYKNMPIEVFFFKNRKEYEVKTIFINNENDSFNFTFNFKPVYVCLDYNQKLADAITDKTIVSNTKTSYDMPETFAKLNIIKATDSALIRLEHHWVGPEKFITTQPAMSNYRYITLDGIWQTTDTFNLELNYDGRAQGTNATLGYLDHTLITKTEDSLTVLYRGFPGDYWRPYPNLQFTTGGKLDKTGKVLIKNAQKGDYVFAMYNQTVNIETQDNLKNEKQFTCYPNPTSKEINLNFTHSNQKVMIEIYSTKGELMYQNNETLKQDKLIIDSSKWANGTYVIQYFNETKNIYETQKVVVVN